jgi:hypothetical protein
VHFNGHLLVLGVRVARAFEATDLSLLQLVGLAHVLSANRILFIAPDLEAARRLHLEFELAVWLHVLVLAALRPLVQVGILQSDSARDFLLGHGLNEFRSLSVLKVRYARGSPGCWPHLAGVDRVVGVDSLVMVVVNRILVITIWSRHVIVIIALFFATGCPDFILQGIVEKSSLVQGCRIFGDRQHILALSRHSMNHRMRQ